MRWAALNPVSSAADPAGVWLPAEMDDARSAPQVLVGRQPIFGTDLRAHGYELVFCDPQGSPPRPSADEVTARVLTGSVFHVGLSSLIGDRLAFLSTSRRFFVERLELPLPPQRTVLRLPLASGGDPDVVAACRRFVDEGFCLALDHSSQEDLVDSELTRLACYSRVDVSRMDAEEMARCAVAIRRLGLRAIATGVTSRAALESCAGAGFDFFQGDLLARPQTLAASSSSPTEGACLALATRFCDLELPLQEVVEILSGDPPLATRVLWVAAAGSASGTKRDVASLSEAVVLLGRHRLAGLVTLLLLAGDTSREPIPEVVTLSASRARMLELVAEWRWPGSGGEAFLVGMLSCVEILFRRPLPEVMAELPVEERIASAVLAGEGPLGRLLYEVTDYEKGILSVARREPTSLELLEDAYLEAVAWAQRLPGAVETLAGV